VSYFSFERKVTKRNTRLRILPATAGKRKNGDGDVSPESQIKMFKFIFDKKNRGFMRLWWAQLISQFGDRINQMALIGLVAERAPGSALGLAKLLSFTIIPVFLIGPIAGVYVDRWDKRRTLLVCDIIRGLLVLTIPLLFMYRTSMVPIYIIVFLIFCFSRFYVPAKMSIIPELVAKENLLVANSLMTTTGMLAFVIGCVLGGFMVDWFGARGGFLGDAVTFFFSAALIMSIPRDLKFRLNKDAFFKTGQEMMQIERSFFLEIKEGIKYLAANKGIRLVINTLFILLAAAGAIYVVVIVFIQEAFQSVTKDLGILAVALGIGLFTGTVLYGKWGKRWSWQHTIFYCLIAGGVMMMIFATVVWYVTNIWVALGLALALGIVVGPIFIATNTIVHLVADEKMRGKVFSALEIVIHFAFLVAMLLCSKLSEYVPRVWILVGVGGVFSFVGIMGLWTVKKEGLLAVGSS